MISIQTCLHLVTSQFTVWKPHQWTNVPPPWGLFQRFPEGKAALLLKTCCKIVLRPAVRSWFAVKSDVSSACWTGQFTVETGAKRREKKMIAKNTQILFLRMYEFTETCSWKRIFRIRLCWPVKSHKRWASVRCLCGLWVDPAQKHKELSGLVDDDLARSGDMDLRWSVRCSGSDSFLAPVSAWKERSTGCVGLCSLQSHAHHVKNAKLVQ